MSADNNPDDTIEEINSKRALKPASPTIFGQSISNHTFSDSIQKEHSIPSKGLFNLQGLQLTKIQSIEEVTQKQNTQGEVNKEGPSEAHLGGLSSLFSHSQNNASTTQLPGMHQNKNIGSILGQQMILKVLEEDGVVDSKKDDGKKAKFGVFNMHGKIYKFDTNSLFLFSPELKFRKGIVWLITWRFFDYFILLVIFLNTLTMSIYDYSDLSNTTMRNKVVSKFDYIFTAIFTVEALLKTIGMGFIVNSNSYLRDNWNKLDFTVVILGISSVLPNVPNLKSFRAIRVIRPLRTINSIPGMKMLVSSLLSSLPQMWNVIIFLLFVILIYGILGVQIFQGATYQQCRLTPEPVYPGYWPIDQTQTRVCGGAYTCNPGTYCGAPDQYNITFKEDNISTNVNINYGLGNFDNILIGIQFIFCLMTLDSWTNDMYNYMDSSISAFAVIYFIFVVITLAFFLLNYFLAIIMNTFRKMQEKNRERLKLEKFKDDKIKRMMEISHQALAMQKQPQLSNLIGGFMYHQQAQEQQKQLENKHNIGKSLSMLRSLTINTKKGQSNLNNTNPIDINTPTTPKRTMTSLFTAMVSASLQHKLNARAESNCYYGFCFKVIQSYLFLVFINLSILGNTICLSLDTYPVNVGRESIVEKLNYVFFAIFLIEMILKLGGLGFKLYVSDKFNIFDALIVILSILDIVVTFAFSNFKAGQKAIMAFRGFRLLRVFKLAKSWQQFQYLLSTIADSLMHMGSFSILLLVFIVIYILFGLEIFAHQVKFNSLGYVDLVNGQSPDINCDTFLNAFVTLFIVLTQENWRNIMYQFTLAKGPVSYLFFISFMIFGQMILLNLFMAILLENFDITKKNDKKPNEIEIIEMQGMLQKEGYCMTKIKLLYFKIQSYLRNCSKVKKGSKYLERPKPPNIQIEVLDQSEQMQAEDIQNSNQKAQQVINAFSFGLELNKNNLMQLEEKDASSETIERQELKKNQSQLIDDEAMLKKKLQMRMNRLAFARKNYAKSRSTTMDNKDQYNQDLHDSYSSPMKQQLSLKNLLAKNFQEQIKEQYIKQKIKSTFEKNEFEKKTSDFEGVSLYLFNVQNNCRKKLYSLCKSKYFDSFTICLIIVSSIMLALDNPLNDPNSILVQTLNYMDITVTTLFGFEAIFKIISYGFLINGKKSYLRNVWNIVDFVIVVASIISLCLVHSKKLHIIKVFRLLRVLRPLRMISRNEGLRLSLSALVLAIPGIINVIIIQFLFLFIFGMIGISFFKGGLYSCYFSSGNKAENLIGLSTVYDCQNQGGEWVNNDYNFDNIVRAVITLFGISTTEGWVNLMQACTSMVGIGMQPINNYATYWSPYFVFFIIVGNFFIWNLFVGVVISTFNEEKDRLGKNFLLTRKQKEWLYQKALFIQVRPLTGMDSYQNQCRETIRKICQSNAFEITIMVCIVVNSIVLMIDWYDQPGIIASMQEVSNYLFTGIFIVEAIIKLVGFGFKRYFKDKWNIFDFILVVSSIISMIIWNLTHLNVVRISTLIRTFRIARIFRLIRRAKRLKLIFDTFIASLPALANVGGLLMLFLYIYSILGVFLFAEIQLQTNLAVHANFQDFGTALLCLVRCWTGEAWDSIMYDVTRQYSAIFQCSNDVDYYSIQANGGKVINNVKNKFLGITNGCGSAAGYFYFMSFIILIPYTFVNLFIAIILQGLNDSLFQERIVLEEKQIEDFQQAWLKFDKHGTGFITIHELPKLLFLLNNPLGWDSTYIDDQNRQDDFLVELNINTYNNFKDYLFWDVLQGLAKICLIRKAIEKRIKQEKKNEGKELSEEDFQQIEFLLKMELEFEHQTQNLDNIQALKEIARHEQSLVKRVNGIQDNLFSSVHFKAGRIIFTFLKEKVKKIKLEREQKLLELQKQRSERPANIQGDIDLEGLINGFEKETYEQDYKRQKNIKKTPTKNSSILVQEQANESNLSESIFENTQNFDQLNMTNSKLLLNEGRGDAFKTNVSFFSPHQERQTNNQSYNRLNSPQRSVSSKMKIGDEILFQQELQNLENSQEMYHQMQMEDEKLVNEELGLGGKQKSSHEQSKQFQNGNESLQQLIKGKRYGKDEWDFKDTNRNSNEMNNINTSNEDKMLLGKVIMKGGVEQQQWNQ